MGFEGQEGKTGHVLKDMRMERLIEEERNGGGDRGGAVKTFLLVLELKLTVPGSLSDDSLFHWS